MAAATSVYSDGRTPRMVRELTNYIEAEPGFGSWRDAIELDEAFFATFSHKARVALLTQWGLGDRAKGLKSSETAAFCARVANCDTADAKLLGLDANDLAEAVNWLPDFMATELAPSLPVEIEDGDEVEQYPGSDEAPVEFDQAA